MFDGVNHTIRVSKLSYQSIELAINSTPSTLSLNVNEEGEVDLNDDGTNDIAVKYEGVEGTRGVLTIREVMLAVKPIPKPEAPPAEIEAPAPAPAAEKAKGYAWAYFIIAVIVLALAGGIGFVFYEIERSHKMLEQEKKQGFVEEESLDELQGYAQRTYDQGYTKEQIKQALLKEGWSQNTVNRVISHIKE